MRNNKRTLSKEKKDTYIDIALGCKNIAKQFNQLADIYDEAVFTDKVLQGKFIFTDLPPVYALIMRLGIQLYDILSNNGISIEMGCEPLEILMY